MGATRLSQRLRFGRRTAWLAGGASGFLGGLVGNQGGIRSAALLGFDVSKEAFVATATAVGLIVDGARLPIYLATQWTGIAEMLPLVAIATAGVVAGTLWGRQILRLIPESRFRQLVSLGIFGLGIVMLVVR